MIPPSFSSILLNKNINYFIVVVALIFLFIISYFFCVHYDIDSKMQFFIQGAVFILSIAVFIFVLKYGVDLKLKKTLQSSYETIQRYDALSNATSDAIWDYDMITEKVFYNERLVSIFGYSQDELSDNTFWWENNIHPDDKERVITRMNALLEKNRTTWEDEYRFKCKNGDYKIVFDRSYIVRDKQNKPLRLIGAMKDVTLLRTLENQIINKKLKEKNVLGKQLIVAHENERRKIKDELHEDVNQLLASIKFFIKTNKSDNENINQSLLYLDEAMQKINNISNELLSSTFEILGFEDAIKELFEKFSAETPINFELDLHYFNESIVEKNNTLYLYRIIENRLSTIVNKINTKEIKIEVSSTAQKATLKINFESDDINIEETLNDVSANDINVKLEMYEGKMKVVSNILNKYCILVVV
jgi:two-component system, NarL family, sensor histidine kinase UhpB